MVNNTLPAVKMKGNNKQHHMTLGMDKWVFEPFLCIFIVSNLYAHQLIGIVCNLQINVAK